MSTGSLAGRTLFITGASRGIGKAIAVRAAQDGANIVIAAKTAEPHPKLPGTIYTAAKEVEAAGGKCLPCVMDLRIDSQVEEAVDQAVKTFGGIDILVNNASAIHLTGTTDTPMKRYDLMMSINTRGTFLASKLCIPHLRNGKNPHILNISPPLNMKPFWFSNHCAYTMAKYGMSMCVLGMSAELKSDGIAVNALWPRTAISTAAMEMLGGDPAIRMSRKPEIMADAAYAVLTKNSREATGNFFIDDDILKSAGITDLDKYANVPGEKLLPDYFLEESEEFQQEWLETSKQAFQPQTQGSGDTPASVFTNVQTLLNEDLVKEVGATFVFVLEGKDTGNWILDLKNGPGSIGSCNPDAEGDVVFKMDSDDLVAMFKGEISATSAFMGGKLKISGNLGKAMALDKIMGKMRSKL